MAYDVIDTSNFGRFLGKIKTLLTGFWSKEDTTELTIDSTPTANSNNLVKSGGVYSALATKANTTDIPDAVEANPTVPSGTTPTALSNLKVGNDYYSVPQSGSTTLSTDVVTDKNDDTKASTPKSVYDYVGNPIVSLAVPSTPDGTIIATHLNGDTTTIDLNHQHADYPKYYLCTDETEYAGIATKNSSTLYLIPESSS